MADENDAKTIAELAWMGTTPVRIDGFPIAVVPQDFKVFDLEHYLPKPTRARAEVSVEDVLSFVGYFNRFKVETSIVFASISPFRVFGALDYHGPNDPSHCEHNVTYIPPVSREWQRWKGSSGKRMTQTDFAIFMEENSIDIHGDKPSAAQIVEISRSLRAKKSAEFVSDQRLSDGSFEFTYSETVKGEAGRGQLKVPEKFKIAIPIFFNAAKADVVEAFLRYRVEEGKLTMWYDLHRPEYAEQAAFDDIIGAVAKGTGAALFGAIVK